MPAQALVADAAIRPCVQLRVQSLARGRDALQFLGHTQVQRMGHGAQLDAIGDRTQHGRRQQPLHHRQHLGHVGVATAEIAIAIDIGQEEQRRRAPLWVMEEVLEAVFQPLRLPTAQDRQPAQLVARLLSGIVQGLVASQAASEPFDEGIAACHAANDSGRREEGRG